MSIIRKLKDLVFTSIITGEVDNQQKIIKKEKKLLKCFQCGVVNKTVRKRMLMIHCDKCDKIEYYRDCESPYYRDCESHNKFYKSFITEWEYIWCCSIDEMGLDWYKKAREKLIKKIEKADNKKKQDIKNKNKKYRDKIDKW